MAHIIADRIQETSTTAGTGSYALAGAATGFRAFSAVCVNNDTAFYTAREQSGSGWEVGFGTFLTGNNLARTTILSSSNSGSAVNWTGGTLDVFLTAPALSLSPNVQEFSSVGSSTWTKPSGAKFVHILLFAGGGGGGSGRRRGAANVASTACSGGGGGSAGGRTEIWLDASVLSSTGTVTVGDGGTGAVAITVDATNGLPGGGGSPTTFVSGSVSISARGPSAGGFGGSTGASGGGVQPGSSFTSSSSGTSLYTPTGGGGATAAGSDGNRGGYQAGGGGGGSGKIATVTSASNGGVGGIGGAAIDSSTVASGGGGAAGVVATPTGGNGADASLYYLGGAGGGGGFSDSTTSGNGGNGGIPGGGGGGGAAASGSFNSGAGGNGGRGYARVTTYF